MHLPCVINNMVADDIGSCRSSIIKPEYYGFETGMAKRELVCR